MSLEGHHAKFAFALNKNVHHCPCILNYPSISYFFSLPSSNQKVLNITCSIVAGESGEFLGAGLSENGWVEVTSGKLTSSLLQGGPLRVINGVMGPLQMAENTWITRVITLVGAHLNTIISQLSTTHSKEKQPSKMRKHIPYPQIWLIFFGWNHQLVTVIDAWMIFLGAQKRTETKTSSVKKIFHQFLATLSRQLYECWSPACVGSHDAAIFADSLNQLIGICCCQVCHGFLVNFQQFGLRQVPLLLNYQTHPHVAGLEECWWT